MIDTDILTGQNFFEYEPARWNILITNPPYSIKYQWLERCCQLGKPFALLVPVETIGAKAAQTLGREYGLEMLLLDCRVDFKMPAAGWTGKGAQFPVMWLCSGMLPAPILYGSISKEKRAFREAMKGR